MACRMRRHLGNPLATIWFYSRQAFRPQASRSSKRPPLFPISNWKKKSFLFLQIFALPFPTKISCEIV
ncbi:hypothetical protein T4B_14224 [Trichinella pseudospiralis]|uniref:Uncharacterized protein n=2 Tax=Trichinella pseudospiralis TaxID=6337 RepID=A0A0V0XMY0_TRIPS|nr:hypothetical protein T4E_1011 [Trichinella pseudospiralis]KRY67246.1 hypothetical protein T4A_2358 [Trichinella pseudospiralis]KRY83017.1 hypothetical protein T4D_3134 [Trichinella pseudospiralis]KRZ21568.1 hypothetical protein T4B_14224 [Trichinella pseudospiralis]KRZ27506.1 hypothetical protein T4C_4760 [Trichinella pseudospiralis]